MKKIIKKIDSEADRLATNISSKLVARLGSAAAGFIIAGPAGAIVGVAAESAIEDVVKRFLSPRELKRIEKVLIHASQAYKEALKHGASPRTDIDREKYEELFEGTLLKARESYEEKKIPLLGNLFATAPFTSSPIENINQTLITAEQLSYRQLCILSVIGQNEMSRGSLNLSKEAIRDDNQKVFNEKVEGIYYDIYSLILMGLMVQMRGEGDEMKALFSEGDITPQYVRLRYPGRLLFDSMKLDTIDKKDFEDIVTILG